MNKEIKWYGLFIWKPTGDAHLVMVKKGFHKPEVPEVLKGDWPIEWVEVNIERKEN